MVEVLYCVCCVFCTPNLQSSVRQCVPCSSWVDGLYYPDSVSCLHGPASSAENRQGVSQRTAVDGWAGQVSVPFPWHIKHSMCWAVSSTRQCYSHPCLQFSCVDYKFPLNNSCCNTPSFFSMAGSQIFMCLPLNTNGYK